MKWLAGIGLLVLILVAVGVELAVSHKAPTPAQPIAFNHKIHAGEYQIGCEYCHIYARRAAVAGIPSVERCMGCHKITAANNPEVQKLKAYWDRKQPIQWNKVTTMPDFVYFEHWPHIRSGIACQTCHGAVQTMERLHQAKDLTMSYCISCHRERQVSIDCTICHR
jgi:hypothetical protein